MVEHVVVILLPPLLKMDGCGQDVGLCSPLRSHLLLQQQQLMLGQDAFYLVEIWSRNRVQVFHRHMLEVAMVLVGPISLGAPPPPYMLVPPR